MRAFCIHWILCLARTISPWVICLHWVSDTDNDTVPLVSSCTCRGGLEELRDKHPAVSRPTAYSTPPFLSLPRSEYRYTFSAPLAWALWSLKTCTALWRNALTRIFLRPSCPHLLSALPPSSSSVIDGSITFWRSSTAAPLGAHNAVPGPGSCYSPAYHRLQHVPGKPSPSFHLSVSFTDTLSPSSSLFFFLSDLAACSHNLPQAHSLRLIHHCLWPLYAVSPKCQTLATKRKNRGTHFLNTDTQIRMKEYKTPTTWSWTPSSW